MLYLLQKRHQSHQKAKQSLANFAEFILEMLNNSVVLSVHDLIEQVMHKSGYIAELEKRKYSRKSDSFRKYQRIIECSERF